MIVLSRLKEYFKQKTKNISFIEIKKGSYVDVNGYHVTDDIPLPIVVDDLIDEVREGEDTEEIKFESFINGIVYTLGVDPEFKYFKEYKDILYSYDKKIEDYIIYKGFSYISEDKLEIAMIWLRAINYLNNKNFFGRYNYALAIAERAKKAFNLEDEKLGKKFLDTSTEILEEIVNENPDYSLAHYTLGYHYRSKKEFKKSELTWEKFLRLSEEDELTNEVRTCLDEMKDDVIFEEGSNLILEGYSENGLEKLLQIEDKYDSWLNLSFMIGLGYRATGEYEKAKSYFEKVLELNPNQVDALNEMGLCSVYLGEVDKALDYFTKAIELSPEDFEIMCNRGMTYLQINKIEDARKDIMKAYEINPNDEITISCVNELDKYTM